MRAIDTIAIGLVGLTLSCSDLKANETATTHDASIENGLDAGAGDAVDVSSGETDADSVIGGDGASDGKALDSSDVTSVEDGPEEAEACVPTCDRLGDFRCASVAEASIPRQVQVCSLVRGCLQWLDTALCKDAQVCCGGACQVIDAETSCLRPPPPAILDYYVDAATGTDADDAGSEAGASSHPFRSITSAVAAAGKAPPGARRIHVAAGMYDAAHGEIFPIVLRDGTSLRGAGKDVATIQGSGYLDHGPLGGTLYEYYYPTILAGDDKFDTTIAGLTILGDSNKASRHYGILCDRGNAPSRGVPGGVTLLDGLMLGPGHETAVMVSGSSVPRASGCNLRMINSTVTGASEGLVALGCGLGPEKNQVSMQIGDAGAGNTFTWNDTEYDDGHDMSISLCVANTVIRDNVFSDGGAGVTIYQRTEPGHGKNKFWINHNSFARLSWTGLFVLGNAPSIEELNDNTFSEISNSLTGRPGAALALVIQGDDGLFPPMKRARGNDFVDNDVGVGFSSNPVTSSIMLGTQSIIDFGRMDDPGMNTFRCNSMPAGMSGGGDVSVQLLGTGTISMTGNVWDHAPPTESIDGIAANGVDVVRIDGATPKVDMSNGSVRGTNCPPGRVAGP